MALRFYLIPKIGREGVGNINDAQPWSESTGPVRPRYVGTIAGAWQSIDCDDNLALVAADVTGTEHTAIMVNSDVTAVPANLENTVGGALATVQAKLEAANLPAQWVTSGMTWRTVLKWTIRLLLIRQRFKGLAPAAAKLFSGGITLNSTVGDLPAAVRQRLNSAAQSLGLDTSGITLSTTIRVALITLGQQMTTTITVAGEAV